MLPFTMFPTPHAARTVEKHHIIYLHTYYFTTNIHPGTLSHCRNIPQPPTALWCVSNFKTTTKCATDLETLTVKEVPQY